MGRLTTKKKKIKKNDINNNKHYNEYFKWKVGRPNQGTKARVGVIQPAAGPLLYTYNPLL